MFAATVTREALLVMLEVNPAPGTKYATWFLSAGAGSGFVLVKPVLGKKTPLLVFEGGALIVQFAMVVVLPVPPLLFAPSVR